MKNKLTDLNNHLFMQLERLNNEELDPEAMAAEVSRANALVNVSDQITKISGQQLKAVQIVARHGDRHIKSLPHLGEVKVDSQI